MRVCFGHSHVAQHRACNDDDAAPTSCFSGETKSPSSELPPIIWLGAYTICRSLHDKLGLPKSFQEFASCTIHIKTRHESCKTCNRQQMRPVQPCRLYSAVALPLNLNNDESCHHFDDTGNQGVRNEYTIFSTQDQEFCPAVQERCLVGARDDTENDKVRLAKNRPQSNSQDSEDLVYVQIAALCRDAEGEDWVLGYAFRASSMQAKGKDAEDCHEVFLDEERLVFAKLCRVVGAARIHHCSKSTFYRTFFKREDQLATPNTGRQHAKPVPARRSVIAECFWRASSASDTPPPSR